MKKKLVAFLILLFCLCSVPTSTFADTKHYTPPPRKGVIFVVVKFSYSGEKFDQHTSVEVNWGRYRRKDRYFNFIRRKWTEGVVIRLRHDDNDSVPLRVDSDGQILDVKQLTVSPSQWNNPKYQKADW